MLRRPTVYGALYRIQLIKASPQTGRAHCKKIKMQKANAECVVAIKTLLKPTKPYKNQTGRANCKNTKMQNKTHPKKVQNNCRRDGSQNPRIQRTCGARCDACICILGFCNTSLRPLFCIFLGVRLFWHLVVFAVGPTWLGGCNC